MYIISDDSCTDLMMVSNVQGSINEENCVSVTWNWPKSANLKYCVVFAVEEDYTLEEIIIKKIAGTVYEDSFGLRHTMELEKPSIIIKIYPARKNANGEYELINQVKNNVSPLLYKRVRVTWHVEYKPSLLSSTKTAYLQIRGMENLKDGYITYRCVGEGRSDIQYPIDVEKFGKQGKFELRISKKEDIVLGLTEEQKKYVMLSRQ